MLSQNAHFFIYVT